MMRTHVRYHCVMLALQGGKQARKRPKIDPSSRIRFSVTIFSTRGVRHYGREYFVELRCQVYVDTVYVAIQQHGGTMVSMVGTRYQAFLLWGERQKICGEDVRGRALLFS